MHKLVAKANKLSFWQLFVCKKGRNITMKERTNTFQKAKLALVIAVVSALAFTLAGCKNDDKDKEKDFSIKDTIELNAKNLDGTWTSGEKDKQTDITFTKYEVSVKSKAIENDKDFAKGSYSIDSDSKDKMELDFPDRQDAQSVKVRAAVNKDELEIIVTDEKDSEAKALEGVYKRANKKEDQDSKKAEEKEDKKDAAAEEKQDAKKEESKESASKSAVSGDQAAEVYKNVIANLGDECSYYAQYDINGDGTPELITELGSNLASARTQFYTIDPNSPTEPVFIQEGLGSFTDYEVYDGKLYSFWCRQNHMHLSRIDFKDGKVDFTTLADEDMDICDDATTAAFYQKAGLDKSKMQKIEYTTN